VEFNTREEWSSVAEQPDGKLVFAGSSDGDILLLRYEQDGTPDPSFGDGGVVVHDFGGSDDASAVLVQPDGRIVVAGSSGSPRQFTLLRYTAGGELDLSFGKAGRAFLPGSASLDDSFARDLTWADGRLVAVGQLPGSLVIARFDIDGVPDATFGTGGMAAVGAGTWDATVAMSGSRAVVAAGTHLYAFTDAGTRDPAFGDGGVVHEEFFEAADLLALPDGRIVVAGSDFRWMTIRRVLPDGRPDPTFGTKGRTQVQFSYVDLVDYSTAVALDRDPDGRLIVTGAVAGRSVFVRLLPGGDLDSAFGRNGNALVPLSGASELSAASGALLDADGRLVAAGSVRIGEADAVATRLRLPDTVPEPVPRVSVGGALVVEGDHGTTSMHFAVSLSAPAAEDVTVRYETRDLLATSPADYTARLPTNLTIPAGQVARFFTVTVRGDTLDEHTFFESFEVLLSGASVPIATASAVGHILDDDATAVSVGDASVREASSGWRNATFTISLSRPVTEDIAVTYATANATASAGADYAARAGTVNIRAGHLYRTVTVPVKSDATDESDETFELRIAAGSHALERPVGIGTIVDHDGGTGAAPVLSIGDSALVEGDFGWRNAYFTVSLSASATHDVVVDYATVAGTAGAGDFAGREGSRLTILAGRTTALAKVAVRGDTVPEGSETFDVVLSGANVPVVDAAGRAVLHDDDEPTVAVGDAMVAEGDTGVRYAMVDFTLSAPASEDVVVGYRTADEYAVASIDYVPRSGVVTIPAGQRSRAISVRVLGDRGIEVGAQHFAVEVTTASVPVTRGRGLVHIRDDDAIE
jgi:uncharacterized delta-60 repeat protein